jgi:hypothetical protein
MPDRIAALSVVFLLCALGPLPAQTTGGAGTHDSTLTAAKVLPTPADDNLNLDDSGTLTAPAKKPVVPAAAPATPTPTPTATVPAAVVPATVVPAAVVPATVVPAAVVPATATPAAATPIPAAAPPTVAPTGTPVTSGMPVGAKDSTLKSADEDLILEGGEDELLDQAKVARKKAAEAKANALLPDSAHGRQQQSADHLSPADQSKAASTIPTPSSLTVPTAVAPVADLPVPVAIEKTHSINFAKNLKEYCSPKLAMLMSLILPGSGEVYAQSNIWAAGFVVAEAAIMVGGASLASTATKKTTSAHTYANKYYNDSNEVHYIDSLRAYLKKTNGGEDSLFSTIFDSSDLSLYQSSLKPGAKGTSYYTLLMNSDQSSPFIRGWQDATPSNFTSNGWQLNPTDTGKYTIAGHTTNSITDSAYLLQLKSDSTSLLYGQSKEQQVYSGMMQSAIKFSNYSRDVFLTLIINHLASAIAAGILAKQHNDELLGQETFWQHVGVNISYVNTGTQSVPDYAFEVKF